MSQRYNALSNQELILMIQKDDYYAFDVIYSRHWPKIYVSSFNICRDRDMASEVCQEVFIWLWEHRKRINIVSTLEGYLFAAVKFKIISQIRKGVVRKDFLDKISKVQAQYRIDDEIEVRELNIFIQQFTNTLPEKCAQIFKMSRYEFMSNKEIAMKLGVSEKTVENQITIALKKLKVSLGRLSCWFPLL